MNLTIVDYKSGNISSVINSFEEVSKDILDKKQSAKDDIQEIKTDIISFINKISLPDISKSNKIKEKIEKRRERLQEEYKQALIDGDIKKQKKLRLKLKEDGIQINEKIRLLSEDIMKFFDSIEFPKLVLPKDKGTLSRTPTTLELRIQQAIIDISKLNTNFIAKNELNVKTMLKKLLNTYGIMMEKYQKR